MLPWSTSAAPSSSNPGANPSTGSGPTPRHLRHPSLQNPPLIITTDLDSLPAGTDGRRSEDGPSASDNEPGYARRQDGEALSPASSSASPSTQPLLQLDTSASALHGPPVGSRHRHSPSAGSLGMAYHDGTHLAPSPILHHPHSQAHGQGSHSPAPSFTSSSGLTPPSPTLTNSSSVHFSDAPLTPVSPSGSPLPPTSLALRDNHPTAESGKGTLPSGPQGGKGHQRGWSVATWTSDDTRLPPSPSVATGAESNEKPPLSPSSASPSTLTRISSAIRPSQRKARKAAALAAAEEARKAALDPEQDKTDPTPFREKPSRLAMLVDPKSLGELEAIGGIEGLLEGLGVDGKKGLGGEAVKEAEKTEVGRSADAVPEAADEKAQRGQDRSGAQWKASMEDRRRVYGRNDLPERKSKSLLLLMWMAFKDKVLILLTVAAVVSLALGLYQDLGAPTEYTFSEECPQGCAEPKVDWVEGVAIVVAVVIVVLVGSVNDWQKERQFKKLNEKREDRNVKVIRGGNECVINVRELVVGDVALLEPGEIIPVDGVFLRGHNVRCDESGATGESDAIKKFSYDECVEEAKGLEEGKKAKRDCFLVSGAKVLEGVGEYVVISVGTNSFNGRIMMAMRGEAEETPLQLKLNHLAELIAKAGAASGALLFAALMIRFFVQLGRGEPVRTANQKAQSFIQILIISVTVIVVAVPEGLPLAVTLALAFATKRMTKQNLLVRVLGSCETMANATVVCTDKTGTLTQNVMSVVAGSLGVRGKFVRELADNAGRSALNAEGGGEDAVPKSRDDFSFDMLEGMGEVASPAVRTLFNEAICVNSTAFEDKDEEGTLQFVGSKTETALLRFAKELGWRNWRETRESAQIVQMIPFSSELKAMGVVVKKADGKGYRLYLKGASEILTKNCDKYIVVHAPGTGASTSASTDEIETAHLGSSENDNIQKTIIFYANQTLRTIALCYRDFEAWPPAEAGRAAAGDDVPFDVLSRELTLIAITGIEDPLRPGVKEAVERCQHAGVGVKMCTGDNVLTARSIANQCGIFTPGGVIMEGPVFRKLSDAERLAIVPRLQILARSSPEDKRLLVKTLKSQGEVVGVTGDGTNDGPALKLANVGFAMGIAGTEVAKEASDIIIMDDSFSSLVLAIMWGRCVNDSVKKFLQFQISVNITAVVITFVSAVASDEEESVLTAVQLLWVNLIMDTFAALALATDPARMTLLDRAPDKKHAPLITVEMLKMILVQAAYQIIVCLVLHFAGHRILHQQPGIATNADLSTLVFNAFVFCQIFNQLNCRRLDRRFNVLEGFFRNYYFMAIFAIMVGGQILIMFVGGAAFQVTRISGRDWAISIVVGALSIPIGAIVRMLPTAPFERLLIRCRVYPDPAKLPTVSPDAEDDDAERAHEEEYIYDPAFGKVKDNLATYANLRGGRLRASSIVARSRRERELEQADIQLPSLLAMVPTLVAGTVGAGSHWVVPSPTNALGLGLENPAGNDPSRSTADLWASKVQVHPGTADDDPIYEQIRRGSEGRGLIGLGSPAVSVHSGHSRGDSHSGHSAGASAPGSPASSFGGNLGLGVFGGGHSRRGSRSHSRSPSVQLAPVEEV